MSEDNREPEIKQELTPEQKEALNLYMFRTDPCKAPAEDPPHFIFDLPPDWGGVELVKYVVNQFHPRVDEWLSDEGLRLANKLFPKQQIFVDPKYDHLSYWRDYANYKHDFSGEKINLILFIEGASFNSKQPRYNEIVHNCPIFFEVAKAIDKGLSKGFGKEEFFNWAVNVKKYVLTPAGQVIWDRIQADKAQGGTTSQGDGNSGGHVTKRGASLKQRKFRKKLFEERGKHIKEKREDGHKEDDWLVWAPKFIESLPQSMQKIKIKFQQDENMYGLNELTNDQWDKLYKAEAGIVRNENKKKKKEADDNFDNGAINDVFG